MENKSTDERIVNALEYALKNQEATLLFQIASVIEKRALFEDKLSDLLNSLPDVPPNASQS